MENRFNLAWVFGLVLLVGLIAAGVLAFLFLRPNTSPLAGSAVLLATGQPAPPLALLTVKGEPQELEKLRGRPVIVHFWTLRCEPCKEALVDLQEIHTAFPPDRLALLALNYKGSLDDVAALGASLGVTFPLLLDSEGNVTGIFGVNTFPTTFFIDSQGIIRHVETGRMEKALVAQYLDEILVAAEPTATLEPEATATLAPSATPQPTPAVLEGCVTASVLNGRVGPGKAHEVMAGFRKDQCLEFDGRSGDSIWLRLASPAAEDGRPLWVSAEFIDLKGELSDLPPIE